MGLFGPSKAQREWDKTAARHRREDAEKKEARAQRKAEDKLYGRRGRGIVCGWANDDDVRITSFHW